MFKDGWIFEATAPSLGEMDTRSSDERLNEIAEILALGLQRLLARQSSRLSADIRESSLDIPPHRSGHPEGFASENGG
jgi:hypothetical protein